MGGYTDGEWLYSSRSTLHSFQVVAPSVRRLSLTSSSIHTWATSRYSGSKPVCIIIFPCTFYSHLNLQNRTYKLVPSTYAMMVRNSCHGFHAVWDTSAECSVYASMTLYGANSLQSQICPLEVWGNGVGAGAAGVAEQSQRQAADRAAMARKPLAALKTK